MTLWGLGFRLVDGGSLAPPNMGVPIISCPLRNHSLLRALDPRFREGTLEIMA